MTTSTLPGTPSELEEWLGDANFAKNNFDAKGQPLPAFGERLNTYIKNVAKRDTSIKQQIDEQVQVGLQNFYKDSKVPGASFGASASLQTAAQRSAAYNPKAHGAGVDHVVKDTSTPLAKMFTRAWYNSTQNADPEILEEVRALKNWGGPRNSFGSEIPDAGGFLIPEVLRSTLLQVALERSIVRSRAMVVPMETLRVPFPALDDTSHASSVFGGVVAYWTEEGASAVESQASFGRVVLEAGKLTIYAQVPNELISDAGLAFEAFLNRILPQAIAYYEDDAFLNGTGAGLPKGVLKGDAVVKVTRKTAGHVVWEDIASMYSTLLPQSMGSAVFVVNPSVLPDLFSMAMSVGTGGVPVWLPGDSPSQGAAGAPMMTLMGRPVLVSEKVPALGTAGDISLLDLGFYLVGDRQAMSLTSSPHYKFQSDVTAYKLIERVDGRPWLNSAITTRQGSVNLTPFVTLS